MAFFHRLIRLPRVVAAGASLATARFPVAVCLIVVFSLVSNAEVSGRFGGSESFVRILATLSAAAAASIAVTLALEASALHRIAINAASALAAAAIGAAIWFSEPFPIYAPALLISCIAAIPLAPTLGRGTPRDFWSFTLWTAIGVVLAFLSVLVFVLGVIAILEMVRYLFRTDLLAKVDSHLLTTATTLVGPLFALGRIPRPSDGHAEFHADDRLVRTTRPLFEWVSAPLVLVTALVLHVYVGRIVVTGEVPRGEIGWIVGSFSLFVLALRIAIDPFRRDGQWPTRLFADGWVLILFVPLGLLAYALNLRVDAEGVTVERYYLGLWALSVALIVFAQAVPRWRGDIRVIALVPVILLAVSTFGPWGVADTVGRSQAAWIKDEFGTVLSALPTGRAGLTPASARQLESRLFALQTVEELGRVRPVLSESVSASQDWDREVVTVDSLRQILDLDRPSPLSEKLFVAATGKPLNVGGYDLAFPARVIEMSAEEGSAPLDLRFEGTHLELRWNGQGDAVDLDSAIANLPFEPWQGSASSSVDAPEFDLATLGGRHVRVRIEQLLAASETGAPIRATMTVLIRSVEWPAS